MQNILSNREIKLIGFDADDTLWKNENLFFDAQNKIKNILKQKSNKFDEDLLKTEKLNLDIYGYGIKGFILSLIETSVKTSDATTLNIKSINEIIKLGKRMLKAPVNLIEGVDKIFEHSLKKI